MWLLKLHLAVSILCWLTFMGFRTVFKDTIIKNGYQSSEKKKKVHWIFFIPLLNVGVVLVLLVMISMTKENLDKWMEEHKRKTEDNTNG